MASNLQMSNTVCLKHCIWAGGILKNGKKMKIK